jgi:hypothetical protein
MNILDSKIENMKPSESTQVNNLLPATVSGIRREQVAQRLLSLKTTGMATYGTVGWWFSPNS